MLNRDKRKEVKDNRELGFLPLFNLYINFISANQVLTAVFSLMTAEVPIL